MTDNAVGVSLILGLHPVLGKESPVNRLGCGSTYLLRHVLAYVGPERVVVEDKMPRRPWHVQPCIAVNKDNPGLQAGLRWLRDALQH